MENNDEKQNETKQEEVKEVKHTEQKPTISAKSTDYQVIKETTSKKNSSNNFSFGKSVAIPFLSGVVGASLVLGVCFGATSIRNILLTNEQVDTTTDETSSSSNTQSLNTTFISLEGYSDTGVSVANKVLPSVVGITVEYSVNSIFNMSSSTATAKGSGIIISEDGYILTNNHIVNSSSTSSYYSLSEANKVTVNLYDDSNTYDATIIGMDEQTDLAVIKIDKTGLAAAELGDSDSVQVGEFAMAVGNPLGMQSSVSAGIISATNREITTDGNTFTLIQTDTSINSGNSGGALVNSKGQVIGINTLKLSGTGVEGMGFAIPINSTVEIYEQLIEYNKVKRPKLGITGRDLNEQTAKLNNLVVGVYIVSIDEFSGAEKAGLKAGDVITKIDGTSVTTMTEITNIINSHKIDDTITITIYRNGSERQITATLGEA